MATVNLKRNYSALNERLAKCMGDQGKWAVLVAKLGLKLE